MGWRRVLFACAAVAAGTVATAGPAFAGGWQEYSGNSNPAGQGEPGRCAAGNRWVYVSPGAEAGYNPLAKTTDALGANQIAPPNANADAFNDGVTVTLVDAGHASYSTNEATDPTTLITVKKLVVKAGNHYTVYYDDGLLPNTSRSSPAGAASPMAVSHAYVCYSLTAAPPPTVPEVPYPALLAGAAAVGATIYFLRRRPRAA